VITFNDVLRNGGVDPAGVKMLRHTVKGKQILEVWRTNRYLAEAYQNRQKATFFDGVTHAACFLVSRAGETVFGGLYRVGDFALVPPGESRPLTGDPNEDQVAIHQLIPEPAFAAYEDRLVVQWFLAGNHPGWWQWAHKNPKPVVEIATQKEQSFPGWLEFRCPVDDLDGLPKTWQEVLRSTSGIYLLTDVNSKHYVGSAKGGDGFLGRWVAYRNGKSGGNVGLKDATGPFTVSVLQTFDPGTSEQAIERIESLWKTTLDARLVGYNLN
jgi:hypothetical protein